jgi:hypothetical protein
LETVFSVRSVPRLYEEDQLQLRESFETRVRRAACEDVSPGAEERPHWKTLPSNEVKAVNENTSVTVIFKDSHELCIKVSNKSDYRSKPRL